MAFLSEKCLQTCFFESWALLLHYVVGETREGEHDWHLAATRLSGVEMMRCQVI